MIGHKNVTTNRLWLRDDLDDALDRLDETLKLTEFFDSTPNGSAIEQYLKGDRSSKRHEPDSASSMITPVRKRITWPFGPELKSIRP